MEEKDIKLFDALCDMVIYHQADCAWIRKVGRVKFMQSVRICIEAGLMKWDPKKKEATPNDKNEYLIIEKYQEFVYAYARERLPEEYQPSYDFWGAACFKRKDQSTRTAGLPFAGDDQGLLMLFTCYEAMVQYADDKLLEIEDVKPTEV